MLDQYNTAQTDTLFGPGLGSPGTLLLKDAAG
jgi:hypothetical protein